MSRFTHLALAVLVTCSVASWAKKPPAIPSKIEPQTDEAAARVRGWVKQRPAALTPPEKAKGPLTCGGRTYLPGDAALAECQRVEGRYQTPQTPYVGQSGLPLIDRNRGEIPVTGGESRPSK